MVAGAGPAGGAAARQRARSRRAAPDEVITDADPDDCGGGAPGRWIVDPDGAVVRAGLVRQYAARHGLWQLDPDIAYLTGDRLPAGVRGFEVIDQLPLREKVLRQTLSALRLRTAGDPGARRRRRSGCVATAFAPGGNTSLTVVVMRMRRRTGSRAQAFVCRAVRPPGRPCRPVGSRRHAHREPDRPLLVGGAVLTAAPATAAPESCAALGGVVQDRDLPGAGQRPGLHHGHDASPWTTPTSRRSWTTSSQTRDGFVNVASTPDPRNQPFEMDVTAESLRSAQTRSVVLKLFQDVGSAHPTYLVQVVHLRHRRGIPVTFDTLFAPDADPLEVIFPIVRANWRPRTGLAGSISPGDGCDPSHYQNFAITDDAVIFYFGRAELLPSYAGETFGDGAAQRPAAAAL